MLRGYALLALSASALLGCGGGTSGSASSGAGGAGIAAACVAGELELEGGGCLAAGMRENGCPAGQVLDGAECRDPGIPESACAPGFVPDGAGACDAILPAEPCLPGTIALPGDATCAPLGACGDAPWGRIETDMTTQFVDAAFVGASDGSETAPWTSVQLAIDAAQDGATVAIAVGAYAEDLVIEGKTVHVRGRCADLVEIAGSATSAAAVLVQRGADRTSIEGIAITGAAQGIEIRSSLDVVIQAVRVHDTAFRGVYVDESTGPTRVSMDRVLVERAHRLGIWVSGSEVTMSGIAVRDVEAAADGLYGDGIFIEQDIDTGKRARVDIEGSVVERNRKVGVFVAGADVTLTGSVVRDTIVGELEIGRGVQVQDSGLGERGDLRIVGSVIERNFTCGVCVYGSDASIEETVVRDTRPATNELMGSGRGLNVEASPMTFERGTAVVRSSVFSGNHEAAVYGIGSDLDVEGTLVRDTKPASSIDTGRGIAIQSHETNRGSLKLVGSLVERSVEQGVSVIGSDATIEGVLVRDTTAGGHLDVGRGMIVQVHPASGERPVAAIRSSFVERSHEVGLTVLGADVVIEATVVRDTEPLVGGLLGDGLAVASYAGGASATVRGSRFESNARAGVASFGGSVQLGGSLVECNAIELAGEPFLGDEYAFDDTGGNACGCAGASVVCKVLSSGLQPPEPIEPVASR